MRWQYHRFYNTESYPTSPVSDKGGQNFLTLSLADSALFNLILHVLIIAVSSQGCLSSLKNEIVGMLSCTFEVSYQDP